ncbi:MAG: acetate--CoA ligase family protein [Fervidicoccaceae archaeon]|jgi:acetyl coenzyme A synthetase (ADP forming)-like protein
MLWRSYALQLDFLFNPKSIAVVGASNDPLKIGYDIFRNLTTYQGRVYPVNLKEREVMGKKAYRSVQEIEDEIDLVVIAVPRQHVLDVVKESAEKGAKGAIVITAGFGETGEEQWIAAEKKIVEEARKRGMRIVGPNCVGVMNTVRGLNATFIMPARAGKIAFISQSGALGAGIIYKTVKEKIGFSKFVSLGNMADLDFSEFLEYLSGDSDTESIMLYLEGVKDGRKLLSSLEKATQKKPVIVIKGGRSSAASEAVSSHTGSIAGSWEVYGAALKQAGAIIAETIDEALSMSRAFSQPLPKGRRVGIITNAGGGGVLVSDQLEKHGLEVPRLSKGSIAELKKFLPPFASFRNPVDMIASARGEDYRKATEIFMRDDGIDMIIEISVVPTFAGIERDEHARGIVEALKSSKGGKPILALFMAGDVSARAREVLEAEAIPVYERPEDVAIAAKALYEYSKAKRRVNNEL